MVAAGPLRPARSPRRFSAPGLSSEDRDAPRRGHHLIWSLFADRTDRRRDFLWTAGCSGAFITLSARPSDDRHRLFWIESSEPFASALAAGDRVAFRLHGQPRRSRRGRRRANNLRYATLDFEGELTVTNRSRFLRAIATGFGSSRT